jgi:hypothetical protein
VLAGLPEQEQQQGEQVALAVAAVSIDAGG